MAAGDGLISMKPTSIAVGSGTASINADGGVDFSAVTSLSLNGVFTGDYDNYLVVYSSVASAAGNCLCVLRASGSDAVGSNYTFQRLRANGSTVDGSRVSSTTNARVSGINTIEGGSTIHFYGPALAQPTAIRSVDAGSVSGAIVVDYASTHSLSTSYDGMTLFTGTADTMTGTVHVFGYEE